MVFDHKTRKVFISEDAPIESFQRGNIAWVLAVKHKHFARMKSDEARSALIQMYAAFEVSNSADSFPLKIDSEEYKSLERDLCDSWVAWLVEGVNLPKPALGVREHLVDELQKTGNTGHVGAKLNEEIRLIFASLLSVSEPSPGDAPSSNEAGEKRLIKHQIAEAFVAVLGWRVDFLGRMRIAVSPFLSLPILNSLLDEANSDFYLRGIARVIEEATEWGDFGYVGFAAAALLLSWVGTGLLESLTKWVLYGSNRKES